MMKMLFNACLNYKIDVKKLTILYISDRRGDVSWNGGHGHIS